MATVNLVLGTATTISGTPVYVNDGTALGDADFATYIELANNSFPVPRIAQPFGMFAGQVTNLTVTFTVSRTTTSVTNFTWDIGDALIEPGGGGSSVDVGSSEHITAAVGDPYTITRLFDDAYFAPGGQGETDDFVSPSGMTQQEFLAAIVAVSPGPRISFQNSSSFSLRIHEVVVSGDGEAIVGQLDNTRVRPYRPL